MKILLVHYDRTVFDAVSLDIKREWQDCTVICASDGDAGRRAFFEHAPDVVVLDLTPPHENGFEVLREIRRVSDVPVLLLTSRSDEAEQVRGLEYGADDCIVKPFSHLALMAHIKAVLRRAERPLPTPTVPSFVAGELAVNFESQRVTVGGEPVKLTPLEYRLLYHFVRNAGRVLPHRVLLDRVWGEDGRATRDYIKVFVSRLRAKLERRGGPHYIETERGAGYRFVRPARLAPSA